ncbi:MAG: portal protein, partial [Fluviibacter sp.]
MADPTGMRAAANVANGNTPKSDVLATARSRLDQAVDALSESREDEIDDLRFYAGSPDNQWQWPADVLATRGAVQGQTINARPTLTINKLPQHVHQVTNDMRQNRPGAKVIPVDDNADVEVAEVFNGMIRHIEYISDADVAYDTACENQVAYGEGYIRILTEYCDPTTFDQDIKIGRIRNSFSVYMDPLIQDPTGADAKWCFITEDLTKDEYERLYPDASPVSTLQSLGVGDQSISNWLYEDTIRIADYYYIDYEKATLHLYPGNQTAFAGTPEDKDLKAIYGAPKNKRLVQNPKVKYCKINGYEILEEAEWAGKWIPVVRIVGNEFEVDGRLYVSGLVRNAKDAQRMYNYWVSQEAEMLALAPKAPFIGYGGQFEGYED